MKFVIARACPVETNIIPCEMFDKDSLILAPSNPLGRVVVVVRILNRQQRPWLHDARGP